MHPTSSTFQRDAFSLLFLDDFEGKPLFKSQVDLVNELLSHPESDYHIGKENKDEYPKAVSRMKAFVSQLFSEHSKRSISQEFKRSLEIVLQEKSRRQRFDVSTLLQQVVTDLKDKNIVRRHTSPSVKKEPDMNAELAYEILHSTAIIIFTARAINIELKMMSQKISINTLLIEDLICALKSNQPPKKYHFNFPLEQTCILFWKGMREELANFIATHSHLLSSILRLLRGIIKSTDSDFDYYSQPKEGEQSTVASDLLQYLSNESIVNVYHLQAPVYIASIISLEQNQHTSSTYLCLKSDEGQDQLHKLSREDMFLSTFFVWNYLKMTQAGCAIRYQASY